MIMNYPADSAPGQILQHLQRNGEATIKDVAALLGITATAVRDHMATLQSEGLIVVRSERYGPGRPRMVYALSEKAQGLFPKQYDKLIISLLRELVSIEGPEMVELLLERVSRRLAGEYADRIAGTDTRERLDELKTLLEQRGVPSEVGAGGESLQLFACPFYEIAHQHPEVCSMERQMIEYVLGEKLVITNTIREGAHNCRFVLRGPNNVEIPLILEEPKGPQRRLGTPTNS